MHSFLATLYPSEYVHYLEAVVTLRPARIKVAHLPNLLSESGILARNISRSPREEISFISDSYLTPNSAACFKS